MKFLKKKQIDTAEVQQDVFTGNGVLTEFTLTFTVMHVKQLFVTIDGLTQEPTVNSNVAAYSINNAGTKVVFTEAPPNLLSFEKDKRADFLSKSVLPRKVPNPVPAFEVTSFDLDLM